MSHTAAAPVLVSTATAAEMLDISPRMVLYYIAHGKLAATKKLGTSWRVSVRSINELAASATTATSAA